MRIATYLIASSLALMLSIPAMSQDFFRAVQSERAMTANLAPRLSHPSDPYNLKWKRYRHRIKIGVGDMYTDAMAFGESPHRSYISLPESYHFLEQQDYNYCPHVFAEYSFRLSSKIEIGIQGDFFSFDWKDVRYQGGSDEPVEVTSQWCSNYALMPQIMYIWKENGYWRLYSTLRAGLAVNTGSQTDIWGNKTVYGVALSPTLIGVDYARGDFFVAAEIGSHIALANDYTIFSALSKAVSVSVGVRF